MDSTSNRALPLLPAQDSNLHRPDPKSGDLPFSLASIGLIEIVPLGISDEAKKILRPLRPLDLVEKIHERYRIMFIIAEIDDHSRHGSPQMPAITALVLCCVICQLRTPVLGALLEGRSFQLKTNLLCHVVFSL